MRFHQMQALVCGTHSDHHVGYRVDVKQTALFISCGRSHFFKTDYFSFFSRPVSFCSVLLPEANQNGAFQGRRVRRIP